jgi:hypothetical protein
MSAEKRNRRVNMDPDVALDDELLGEFINE